MDPVVNVLPAPFTVNPLPELNPVKVPEPEATKFPVLPNTKGVVKLAALIE